ncbi:MAG: N-acetyl-gamma-glutamyl-phosphate reductase [Cyclobacteriaceae bacterium]|nr:N-acetyl-gamma-glutamyl-phosphate reductase [Cyclobacteriaceae bacterium]
MIQVGIAGGAGYTAGELLRILINHPKVEVKTIMSSSFAGKKVHEVHQDLIGSSLQFSSSLHKEINVLFLCMGHGKSKLFLEENTIPNTVKIIDLSHDFRLHNANVIADKTFIYGLPEINKDKIASANNIANPGCFATAIQEALLPLAANNWLTNNVHINAITGATGAGQQPTETTHFSWRSGNVSVYKPFTHQHLAEIGETLVKLQPGFNSELNFVPVRGNFTRGIFATLYTKTEHSINKIKEAYSHYFKKHPFVLISDEPIHLKQVVNTNNVILHLNKIGDQLLITCIIDNLIKGASGQATQNMNLMFGLAETTGLNLKASLF